VSYRYSGSKRTPEFSDGCFKCECEALGSTGEYCAVEGGQCPCQKGQNGAKNVVGRRCNECEDKQGQIVNGRGCVGEYNFYYMYQSASQLLGRLSRCHAVLFMVVPAIWERTCVTPLSTLCHPMSRGRAVA